MAAPDSTEEGAPPASLVLDGTWQATPADDDLRRDLHGSRILREDSEPIEVPGHWRSTAAFSDNDSPLLYQRRFEHEQLGAEGARAWLELDGVFYHGDIWLDGDYLGNTEGYFFPHAFEVTEALRAHREHDLAVEVGCAPPDDRRAKRAITGIFGHWDCIDPAWNPGGIWRPVRIVTTGAVRILHFRALCQAATPESATVALRAVLDAPSVCKVTLRTRIAGVEVEQERTLAAGENRLEWTVNVANPALWWPHALGEQPLHDLEVAVLDVDGGLSDQRTMRLGLRSIVQDDWVLRVNGERLFLKGTNLAPTRRALGEATAQEIARDVQLARDAGLDLIRVHAHVSRPELYDTADELGMLVWQDFPLQWGYSRSIRRQARRQAREMVDLLAHHASIALWCGHNEPLATDAGPEVWQDAGAMVRLVARGLAGQFLPSWNKSVLDASVKRVLERTDGSRPVVAHSGVLPHLPQLDGTDTHVYFGWYHNTERDLPRGMRLWPRLARFVSEFGAQAVPNTAEFMEPDRWPDLDWEHLERHHALQRTLLRRFVPPIQDETFDDWRTRTQQYQALLVRRHIEELRRIKYRPTGGFCQFMLADAQPAVSWAVLDHERVAKLGYEALRAACAPVIVVADRLPDHLHPGQALRLAVHAVSDLRDDLPNVRAWARLRWAGGHHTWQWEGDLPADSCAHVGWIDWTVPEDCEGPVSLDLELRRSDVLATNRDDTVVAAGHGHHH